MNKILKLIHYLFNKPSVILLWVLEKDWFPISDESYIKLWYRFNTGEKLNLDNPVTYNEKLQWLKLYNHQPIYTEMVDKYAVKRLVSEKIGSQYVVPLLGVWDSPSDIDFESLPRQFVLKVTHGGGNSGVVVCKDKACLDKNKTINQLNYCMASDGSVGNKEWPYKNVIRRVIAEEYLEDNTYHELRDYKFFCFNGEPKIMFIASGRGYLPEPYFDFFDMDFNHLNIKSAHPVSSIEKLPTKPTCWDEMKRVAATLSQGLPHVRLDLYEVNGKVYFGEYTFFHWAGCGSFEPKEWQRILGDWITLPTEKVI